MCDLLAFPWLTKKAKWPVLGVVVCWQPSVDGIVIVSIQSAKLGHTNRRRTLLTLSRTRGHSSDCSVGTFDQCKSHQPSPYIGCLVELEMKVKRWSVKTGGLVSIVSYSHPSPMIIVLPSQFHVYLPWGQPRKIKREEAVAMEDY